MTIVKQRPPDHADARVMSTTTEPIDWTAIDHYSRGWAAGYRAACERVEGPTEPLEAFDAAPLSVDEGPTRPMLPRMVHVGCYSLTVIQSVAWHSPDAIERDRIRADIRRACVRLLEHRHEASMPIRDTDGTELERVQRPAPP